MTKESRALPPVQTGDAALDRWIRAVNEAFRKAGLETSETREEVEANTARARQAEKVAKDNQSGLVTDDQPPVPSGLTVAGAQITNIIAWDDPGFLGYAYTEVWRNSSDNLSNAELIRTAAGRVAVDEVGDKAGTTYYYWIRYVKNYEGTLIKDSGDVTK